VTVPAATPGLPAVHVTHGAGALVLCLRNDRGISLGTTLHPDAADRLAEELRNQAADARRLMDAHIE
jgi:hypothetical protein